MDQAAGGGRGGRAAGGRAAGASTAEAAARRPAALTTPTGGATGALVEEREADGDDAAGSPSAASRGRGGKEEVEEEAVVEEAPPEVKRVTKSEDEAAKKRLPVGPIDPPLSRSGPPENTGSKTPAGQGGTAVFDGTLRPAELVEPEEEELHPPGALFRVKRKQQAAPIPLRMPSTGTPRTASNMSEAIPEEDLQANPSTHPGGMRGLAEEFRQAVKLA